MMDALPVGIIVAALGGLAIGVERQWSGHATGPRARFAGIRTFTLLGAIGGVSGWLWTEQVQALASPAGNRRGARRRRLRRRQPD